MAILNVRIALDFIYLDSVLIYFSFSDCGTVSGDGFRIFGLVWINLRLDKSRNCLLNFLHMFDYDCN
jgi:hypothetical protein